MRDLSAFNRRISAKAGTDAALRSLADDLGSGDSTSNAVLGGVGQKPLFAFIRANSAGVLCGAGEALAVFSASGVNATPLLAEGREFRKGAKLLSLRGPAKGILAAERTALDYLMVLSGVATASRRLANKFGRRVAATRKTHPGMSASEKRAVQIGGGLSHRHSLCDAILIKDNYVGVVSRMEGLSYIGALKLAVERAVEFRRRNGGVGFVEAEARNLQEAVVAANAGADAVLLDNMSVRQVRAAVAVLRRIRKRVVIEASGGITEKNAGRYLACGVDFVSMGLLTLASKPVDMSLDLV
ncbi:MAG: carboxylating nicotinate-nucleotide diphosphorylase [Candidatus Micrarchaeota archaeon]